MTNNKDDNNEKNDNNKIRVVQTGRFSVLVLSDDDDDETATTMKEDVAAVDEADKKHNNKCEYRIIIEEHIATFRRTGLCTCYTLPQRRDFFYFVGIITLPAVCAKNDMHFRTTTYSPAFFLVGSNDKSIHPSSRR